MEQMKEQKDFSDQVTTNQEKSKKEDLKDSLSLFGMQDVADDLDSEFNYQVNIPKETTDNILKISRIIRVATLTISGFEEQPTDEGKTTIFKLVKHPLASSEVIKHFESILKPYSDEANLITKKTLESFEIQAFDDWDAFKYFCLREKASPEKNERTVYRVFQGCIINIGEITCDNPQNINKLFSSINNKMEEESGRNIFKNE